ncbi:DUF6442 family protein [Paenibacillus sp. GbtcB18]|uniref:DUF6442 family protein n=1 Tax=Paenibacillus sp. GbtcB18 TaxID=2824763 RepID=UPI001C311472|nr:DUF6442 family protein [Paenibacillus sp. GbtcB18]
MKKEEIQEKSRFENEAMDEREHKIDDDSIYNGMLGILVVVFLYLFFKMFTDQPVTDMVSILTANLTVVSFYKYKKIPKKIFFLINTIVGAIATVGFMTAYVIGVIAS